MGKRSKFERIPRDFYPTPKEAVIPLIPHLKKNSKFFEPCSGDGSLCLHLDDFGHSCIYASDIEPQGYGIKQDAFDIHKSDIPETIDYIITNPPWSRDVLHPMIEHFRNLLPTWLLFDADWVHTKQAVPYLKYCSDIVAVGRVKWIPDSKHTGKDNCCWYQFQKEEVTTRFHSR